LDESTHGVVVEGISQLYADMLQLAPFEAANNVVLKPELENGQKALSKDESKSQDQAGPGHDL